MYKLLIADDEPLIVKGLAKIIRKRLPGIETILEATTYGGACALIRSEAPDIVITDIEMDQNGLSLPEEAVELPEAPAFVVISGYNRFDYAQRALRGGVEDFLLKPIDDDELIAVLQKLIQRIRKRREMNVRLQSSEEISVESSLHVLLLGGNAAEGTLSKQMRAQLLGSLHHPQFAILRYFFPDAAQQPPDYAALRPALENALRCCFDTPAIVMIKGFHPGVLLAVINAPQITSAMLEAAARDSLRVLRSESRQEPAVGVSDTVTDMMRLQRCSQQANQALMMHLYEPAQTVYPYSQYLLCVQQLPPETAAQQELLSDMLCLPESEALWEQTHTLYQTLVSLRVTPELILQCFADILQRVQADCQQDTPELQPLVTQCVNALRSAMKYGGNDAYIACLRESMAEVNALLSMSAGGKSRRIIEKAKLYIQEHCDTELMLTDVAEALQMSPNYLSFLFKQETTINFSTYLTRTRIGRAKHLLASRPDMRIYEIAESVGYRNVKYFNRIFKQETDLKPSEFREQFAKS